ncbi:MAG: DNA-binding protein [Maritimibacter sp.]|nr:DNA-binding protein [Maritimibacter sp.]
MSKNYAFAPRLMQENAAAHYVGVSPSKLRTLGIPRRVSGANRLYDIRDLDAWADALIYDGAEEWHDTREADLVFGLAAQ